MYVCMYVLTLTFLHPSPGSLIGVQGFQAISKPVAVVYRTPLKLTDKTLNESEHCQPHSIAYECYVRVR